MHFVVLCRYKGIRVVTVTIDGRGKIETTEVYIKGMLGLCGPSYHESIEYQITDCGLSK